MLISILMLTLAAGQAPSAKSIQVSTPARVSEIDAGKLKGEPTRLAWSPDGTTLFLETSERDARGMIKSPRYFVLSAAEGKPEPVTAPPDWATDYWTWKSGEFAPGSKTFGVEIKEDNKTASMISTPMGGSLAKGGADTGTTADDAAMHAQQMQKLHVFTLSLKGETVGQFVNQQFIPGYTFGWSPQSLGMVAYGNSTGHLALMDQQGQKQQVDGTKNVILPAWSADGSQVAFLQRSGKNKFEFYVVSVKQ